MYVGESFSRASRDHNLGLVVRARLWLIFGIPGNTVIYVGGCTFTNSVVVTLRGGGGKGGMQQRWCSGCGSYLARRARHDEVRKRIRWQAVFTWCLRRTSAVLWDGDYRV